MACDGDLGFLRPASCFNANKLFEVIGASLATVETKRSVDMTSRFEDDSRESQICAKGKV